MGIWPRHMDTGIPKTCTWTFVHSSSVRCTPGERPQLTVEEKTRLSVLSHHSHGSLKVR